MQEVRKILFVINPISGGKTKTDWDAAIHTFFKDRAEQLEFYVETGKDDKMAIQQAIEAYGPHTVVAVGGDGTVKLVAEIIKESTIRLGIIPGGSANGLAKELGIPDEPAAAIDVLVNGAEKKLDGIRINEEVLCFHLSDVGLNALLVKYFEQSDTRGMWGYGRSLFKMLWNKRLMRVTIKTDTETLKRKAYMVALANAEKYGTGAVINPHGDVGDGMFEVVVVRTLHIAEIFKAVTAHRNFNPKNIEIIRTKEVWLRFQQKAPFQVDGEYSGRVAELHARVQPGLVTVLIPSQK